ncbi:MAG: hypothetical protein AAF217_15630 [Pseudomonadota bacterium]
MKREQIERILRVKEMRRKLAEVNYARANREVHDRENAVLSAQDHETHIRATSDNRREERLSRLLSKSDNPALENGRITNIYKMTATEIRNSEIYTQSCKEELSDALTIATAKRQHLAHLLQREDRSKQLRDKVVSLEIMEAIRHE